VLGGAVARAGVPASHIKAVATLAGPFDFLPLDSPKSIAAFGQVDDLAATQPVNQDLGTAPPFLILHGTADTTVFPRNGTALHQRLTAAGREAVHVVYDGTSHVGIMLAIAKPFRGRAPVLADVTAFFRLHP
jgi:acetyl esterase/lipase